MRVPAISAKLGNLNYYITTLKFSDISEHVSKINNELHESTTLSDMIQRAITNNYINIKNYLLESEERFFNSIVLAVYDGDPQWIEVDFDYEEKRYTSMGLLNFSGGEKIFPIDGQHRIEGIKNALQEDSSLSNEEVSVIIISHRKDKEGMQKTRRLFSTLNRYAKPVTLSEIIALDEDDIVAIITRDLVENHKLFNNNNISLDKTKAISESNKNAFTSIQTLYNCNLFLLKRFLEINNLKYNKKFLVRRPEKKIILDFNSYCIEFWDSLSSKNNAVIKYLSKEKTDTQKSFEFRNKEDGGHLLFRPIGLEPFVACLTELNKISSNSYEELIRSMNNIPWNLKDTPWNQVLWNDYQKVMLQKTDKLVNTLLIYMYDSKLLNQKKYDNLILDYSARINEPKEKTEKILLTIQDIAKKNN